MRRGRRAAPRTKQMPFDLHASVPSVLPRNKEREVVLLVAELLLAAADSDTEEVEDDERPNS